MSIMFVSEYAEVSRHSTCIVRDNVNGKCFGKIVDKSNQPATIQSSLERNQPGISKLKVEVNILQFCLF